MKTAILLFNLGGPSALKDVRPFLRAMFRDPGILPLPWLGREVLAWLISTLRAPRSEKLYARLGGSSPLLRETNDQAAALEKILSLTAQPGHETRCFVAMRYTAPLLEQTLQDIDSFAPTRVICLPLYPQYAGATTGSFLELWDSLWTQNPVHAGIDVQILRSFPTLPGFIAALADPLRAFYAEALKKGTPRLILSAHGLPQSMIDAGDPYQQECEKTAAALIASLGNTNVDWTLAYQSRLGPQKWLGPSLWEEIALTGAAGQPLILVPLSFVSEHVETLVELDQDAKAFALSQGVPAFYRVPAPGCAPVFLEGLASLINAKCP